MGGIAWSQPRLEEGSGDDPVHPAVEQTRQDLNEEGDRDARKEKYKQDMENFKQMLQKKREERKQAITKISEEMSELRKNTDDLEKERTLRMGLEKQVKALKEVSVVSNEMLQLRETQVTELKKRLNNLETTAEENLTSLRSQYENQIENIRKLRQLYEERAEAAARGHEKEMEKERAKNTLLELKLDEHANAAVTIQQLNEKIDELEKKVGEKESENEQLKELRNSLVAECNTLTSQLTLINNLFSNMLTGNMDFDLLTQLLQDNHNLITDLIANGDINDTAALLVNIAEKTYKKQETSPTVSTNTKQEIATNLPKVWRMLIELLSSHEDSIHAVQGTSDECYKHVKTPTGSRTVISVSQTFLRLKDLILEKNSLVKEVGRLKTLNGTLENRLDQQEKRLSVVSSELKKTWGIVSKLKVQHRQLHTHEKILRYELQHKRQMLTDLKHELEYCRETWDKAKEKNTQNEHDWELLRKEFALRKSRDTSNSTESGYEDDENSQSPDISTSELEYDLSDSQKSSEMNSPSIEMEDAASDATVIELIDMLEFEDEAQGQDENKVFYGKSTEDCLDQSGSSEMDSARNPSSRLELSVDAEKSDGFHDGVAESSADCTRLDGSQEFCSAASRLVPEVAESAENLADPMRSLSENIESSENLADPVRSSSENLKSSENLADPMRSSSEVTESSKKLADPMRSSSDYTESLENLADPMRSSSNQLESPENSANSIKSSSEILESARNSADSARSPSASVEPSKPSADPTKPSSETPEFAENSSDSARSPSASIEPSKSSADPTKPSSETPEFAENSADSARSPSASIEPSKPSADPTKPSSETPEFGENSSDSARSPSASIEPSKSSADPTKPSSETPEFAENSADSARSPSASIEPSNPSADSTTSPSKTLESSTSSPANASNSAINPTESPKDCSISTRSPTTSESLAHCRESVSRSQPNDEPVQSISNSSDEPTDNAPIKRKSSEEILEARAARLRRLERQCQSLLNQMALTSLRSDTLSTRLEELHEQYGSEDRPDRRTQTEKTDDTPTNIDTTDSDLRQNRLQQMEQNCIDMLENVSDGAELNVRLENICVSSHESNSSNEAVDTANECDNFVNESTQ